MQLLEALRERGLVHDSANEDTFAELKPGTSFYVGFDPTAESLHLGNLVPLMGAMRLGQAGFSPVILFGGATGAIGDPSGKSEERKLLDRETIDRNVAAQRSQAEAIFARAGVKARFVNNLDWFSDVSFLEFLRDVGKHFTVNYMIAKEVVKTRLNGDGISYTEFSYMLLQAFDFFTLYHSEGCRLQVGGSDQWGNITAGLELLRKKGHNDACAFSFPLITNSEGQKFGKSEDGAVFLDPKLTSPYKLHQFLLNTADADVINYLNLFTFLEKEEIAELEAELKQAPEKRAAQTALADRLCDLLHGPDATTEAKKSAEVLFGGSMEGLSESALLDIFADVPSSSLGQTEISDLSFLDLLEKTGAVKSRGEGKRLIQNGGGYLNNNRVEQPGAPVNELINSGQKVFVLRTGKKKYHVVQIVE